jgi:hypothetical protein
MGRVLAAVALTCATAAADPVSPWSVDAETGIKFAPLAPAGAFARAALSGSYLWCDRWFAGAELAIAYDPASTALPAGARLVSYLAFAGARLHAGHKLDVLLGWRAGIGDFDFGFAFARATEISTLAQLSVPLGHQLELRIEPFTTDLYWATSWQLTIGANVGLAWRP